MKIPNPNPGQTNIRPVDQQYENLNRADGTDALVRGLGALGQGIEHVQQVNAARAKVAREKAIGAASDAGFAQAQERTTNEMYGYDEPDEPGVQQIGPTGAEDGPLSPTVKGKHVAGFLDSRGNEAYQEAAKTTERLQKYYDSLITAAPNEETRRHLSQRIDGLKATVHQRIAVHEGEQLKVAEQAASRSLQDSTLRTAANLHNDDEKLAPFINDAVASIKRTSLPEEFEAKKTEYLGKVSKAMIGRFIADGDLGGAAQRLKTDKGVLEEHDYEVLDQIIDRKQKAAQKDAAELLSQEAMKKVAATSRNSYGFLDPAEENKLRGVAMKRPAEEREEALATAERYINIEAERRQAVVNNWTQQADSLRTDGKRFREFPDEMQKQLKKYAPKYVLSVQAHELAEARAAEVRRKGNSREIAEQKAYQAKIDAEYIYELKEKLTNDPSIDPKKVMQDFIARKADLGEAVMVTPVAQAHGKFEAADKSKKSETKEGGEELRSEASDRKTLETSLRNFYKKKKISEARIKELLGNAMEKRKALMKPGQTTISGDEITKLSSDMLINEEREEPGLIYGTNTVSKPAVEWPPKKLAPATEDPIGTKKPDRNGVMRVKQADGWHKIKEP